ncbi:beta-amyrin 6-beta-monooxygenase-like [Eucalyptus grandis]|uniref:beta-amyrin 6-beta-monooxygenase-like n=1 Tax=Eucalyptus grandis TaxID=71139 RepID=UPI00192EAB88|nr:beta-amyrin 6-beta-monooxygenase-like [Eucalyptus grandis]
MDSMTREHLESDWSPYEEVKVFPMTKDDTFALVCRLFMNIETLRTCPNSPTHLLVSLRDSLRCPINVPGTPFNKAVEGGKVIRQELPNIIRQRKEQISEGKDANARDLLSRLLTEADDDCSVHYEMDASNKIIGLLIASHDTTSTAITVIVNYLASLPHLYEKIYKGNCSWS